MFLKKELRKIKQDWEEQRNNASNWEEFIEARAYVHAFEALDGIIEFTQGFVMDLTIDTPQGDIEDHGGHTTRPRNITEARRGTY